MVFSNHTLRKPIWAVYQSILQLPNDDSQPGELFKERAVYSADTLIPLAQRVNPRFELDMKTFQDIFPIHHNAIASGHKFGITQYQDESQKQHIGRGQVFRKHRTLALAGIDSTVQSDSQAHSPFYAAIRRGRQIQMFGYNGQEMHGQIIVPLRYSKTLWEEFASQKPDLKTAISYAAVLSGENVDYLTTKK